MREPTATVFVVDDDSAVRSSLRLLLKSWGLAVATYESATAFLAAYRDEPGCLLLDIRMPGMSGLELQQQLNARGIVIPIVFITGHGDVPMAVEAMQHGAFDFLPKPFRDQDLLERVRRALAKDSSTRCEIREEMQVRRRLDSLTPREREVLQLVTRGTPNKIAAFQLGISQRTVEIHRSRVMEKMGADSLAQLVRMAGPLVTAQGNAQ